MKLLSVIIPCYNEKKYLREIIKKVQNVSVKKEIILVDDGSNDGTREIIKALATEYDNVKYHFHDVNHGKGMAFRTGLSMASGDIVIIQDADLEYDPNDYYAILEKFDNPDVMVVYGSRILNKNNQKSYWRYYLGGMLVTLATNMLYFSRITDEPTCYKVFRTEFIKNIPMNCSKFDLEPEITAKILKRGIKIHEVPISYYPRSIEEGKKINWKDGIAAILTLLKYRFRD